MHTANEFADHSRISPTARMLAYLRSFSDIPYARESSRALGGEAVTRQLCQEDFALLTRFSGPIAEARYKCFTRFTRAHRNVLELAVGTSVGRGLDISRNPRKVYVGVDLPDMLRDAETFLESITRERPANYHLEGGNVVFPSELEAATRHFHSGSSLVVLHEGLWMYLTAEEQEACAENIRNILQRYTGIWVTPDITDTESAAAFVATSGPRIQGAMARFVERITSLTGRNFDQNYFATQKDAVHFFERRGFDVRREPMSMHPHRLTSLAALWGPEERRAYEPALKQLNVWVLSLKGRRSPLHA